MFGAHGEWEIMRNTDISSGFNIWHVWHFTKLSPIYYWYVVPLWNHNKLSSTILHHRGYLVNLAFKCLTAIRQQQRWSSKCQQSTSLQLAQAQRPQRSGRHGGINQEWCCKPAPNLRNENQLRSPSWVLLIELSVILLGFQVLAMVVFTFQ